MKNQNQEIIKKSEETSDTLSYYTTKEYKESIKSIYFKLERASLSFALMGFVVKMELLFVVFTFAVTTIAYVNGFELMHLMAIATSTLLAIITLFIGYKMVLEGEDSLLKEGEKAFKLIKIIKNREKESQKSKA